MPTAPEGRASREAVFAWMVANNAGYAKAAAHFNIPKGTVKSWTKRFGEPRSAPPSEKAPAPTPDLDSLTAREKAKAAINHRLTFLADPAKVTDKAGQTVAIQLGILVDKFPDLLLALDAETQRDETVVAQRMRERFRLEGESDAVGNDGADGGQGRPVPALRVVGRG